ncbi:phosphoribosylglycinamide formyltransferase [Devosia sp. Root105]|uniref:phosphoribosylglycinamide formyltransferase n=1 Tax=Devosia sp. Root105 TaxID=1736423 RepID=UPI0006F95E0D|nr:phosphoribosylglycinamide formyltransferase [Devosia sp. Root105]KQU99018.1 phosphoribosylglycinamide formyltransferase [Devosia sp. Root105]
MTEPKKRVAILISGRGSNMTALIEAAKAPDYPAEIVGVFANKPDAGGLQVAAGQGIATAWRWHKDYPSRTGFELALSDVLKLWRPDFIALAGFMRLFTPEFTEKWQGRMLNVHPALLPLHKGLHPQQQALDAGDSESGCTVHFVTAGTDEGPTILQRRVPILPGDTAETLGARILVEEHIAYPEALAMLARGEVSFEG